MALGGQKCLMHRDFQLISFLKGLTSATGTATALTGAGEREDFGREKTVLVAGVLPVLFNLLPLLSGCGLDGIPQVLQGC